jgi:hypothetical protein
MTDKSIIRLPIALAEVKKKKKLFLSHALVLMYPITGGAGNMIRSPSRGVGAIDTPSPYEQEVLKNHAEAEKLSGVRNTLPYPI